MQINPLHRIKANDITTNKANASAYIIIRAGVLRHNRKKSEKKKKKSLKCRTPATMAMLSATNYTNFCVCSTLVYILRRG